MKNQYSSLKFQAVARGFTLIEMIGVLAIIAILAAAVAPRVFEVIADSRGTRMATEIRAIETAVTRFYADVGTIQDLDANGIARLDTLGDTYLLTLTSRVPLDASNAGTAGVWRRFNGPYLEKFIESSPALGTSQEIVVVVPEGDADEVADKTNFAFDLDNTGTENDTPGTNTDGDGPQRLVVLVLQGVSFGDFEKVDSIFDEGVFTNSGDQLIKGRIKFDDDSGADTMTVLIAYR